MIASRSAARSARMRRSRARHLPSVVADQCPPLHRDFRAGLNLVPHVPVTEPWMHVRLAATITRRSHLCGSPAAYHGGWGRRAARHRQTRVADETIPLADIRSDAPCGGGRGREHACVLVNPLQSLHPKPTARRFPRWSTAPAAAGSPLGLYELAQGAAARSAPARASS